MTASDFSEFYKALHKRDPFPWQTRLAKQVIGDGVWPKLLALPTGSGKTSVLDIAIFALACTADSANRQMPRRIFYVVDRRIIVDSTFEYSRDIANGLSESIRGGPGGIVREVASRLQQLTRQEGLDHETELLHVAVLRGGMYREDAWARSPIQPTICVSTVDQIGSRLLFRGYGVGECSWPIHAGLVGNDSLLILDEAHISRPFSQTLTLVHHYCGPAWSDRASKAFSFLKMTATPEAQDQGGGAFGLSAEDERNEVLSLRLGASKLVTLEEVDDAGQERQGAFARRLRSLAYELAWPSETETTPAKTNKRSRKRDEKEAERSQLPAKVIGIVVNRVAAARAIFELIGSDSERPECEAILLTGRVRPYDRDELLYNSAVNGGHCGWLKYIRADKDRPVLGRPLFVVATQTIEVGADLDFEALISEAAPLDVLRQRFGRVDRLGLRRRSSSYVVARSSSVARDAEDWLYGEALKTTWKLLSQIAKKNKRVDFGIAALQSELGEIGIEQLLSAVLTGRDANAPVLLPAHVDALCQTNPRPAAEPDVPLLLHGEQVAAEVNIIWRAGIPLTVGGESANGDLAKPILEALELLPPTSIESLALPLSVAKRWLESKATRRSFAEHEMADIEGGTPEEKTHGVTTEGFVGVRWRGVERSELVRVDEIRPGDTIVVPDHLGGVDRFGWNPDSREKVADISEVCNRIVRRELVLRLPTSGTLAWITGNGLGEIREQVESLRSALEAAQDSEELQEVSEDVVRFLRFSSFPEWVGDLSNLDTSEFLVSRHPIDGWALTVRRDLAPYNPAFESGNYDRFGGDDDSPSFQRSRKPIPLNEHLQAVGNELRFWCSQLGLDGLADTVCLAGDLHDLGKADQRFQAYLHGGSAVAALRAREPWAKSGTAYSNREENRRAQKHAGLPPGFRHEALSVAMIANTATPQVDVDLLVHLVGTHHGFGRPLPPTVEDAATEEVRHEFRSAVLSAAPNHNFHRPEKGWVDRFWRTTRRFGWWGCAYLEALVRLADRRVSEREQRRGAMAVDVGGRPVNLLYGKPPSSDIAEASVVLSGISGENPLGFLAALGAFRLLAQGPGGRNIGLSWFWDGNWKPRVHGFENPTELPNALWAALNSDTPSVAAFLKEHLTGHANLTVPESDFREFALASALRSARDDRFVSDCYVALGSDAHPTRKGLISDTSLRTLSGAGHQDFLGSMRGLARVVVREHVDAALFSKWRYLDGWKSLRWDPQEDRRYALRAENPSGEKTQSVPGANRLAFEALPLFPTFACSRQVVTRCFSRRESKTALSWPMWSNPLSLGAMEVLLSHSELVEERPNEDKLRPLGIEEVLRAFRITVGHFRNFTPSRALWGATLGGAAGQ